jgi:uncharacterized protein
VRTTFSPRSGTVVAALVLVVGGLLWSKWLPYIGKVGQLVGGTWRDANILAVGGVHAGDPPSWHAAVTFASGYLSSVWKALVVALLISAAVQAWVPGDWLARVVGQPGRVRGAALAGVAGLPSMMCTCCTAPVVVGLRRKGATRQAAVAYWLANPLLNPAVLVFLLLVAPPSWFLTRMVVGVLVVVLGAAVVAAVADRAATSGSGRAATLESAVVADGPATAGPLAAPSSQSEGAATRFLAALARTAIVLLPEYLAVVMLVGACRGWLLSMGSLGGVNPVLAVLLVATVGTLVVLPTAGEIAILQGLVLAGASMPVLGALLITLPVVSLPASVMLGRALGWRATVATAAVAVCGGLAGAVLLGAF